MTRTSAETTDHVPKRSVCVDVVTCLLLVILANTLDNNLDMCVCVCVSKKEPVLGSSSASDKNKRFS